MLFSSTWFVEWFRTTKVFVCVRYAICASREFNARWRNSVELERCEIYSTYNTSVPTEINIVNLQEMVDFVENGKLCRKRQTLLKKVDFVENVRLYRKRQTLQKTVDIVENVRFCKKTVDFVENGRLCRRQQTFQKTVYFVENSRLC